jgi:ribonuclease-3
LKHAADWVDRSLGYAFREPALLDAALTHRSAGGRNYERLEFLGDAVLNCVVAVLLFREYPEAEEGELSRYRATLVNEGSLAEIGAGLELGRWLRLGSGELKSGGHRRSSILADALEGLLGAIYLDGGFAAASTVIERLYAGRLGALPAAAELKDPKTRLQEYLQGKGHPLPSYAVLRVSGEPHEQHFVVSCTVVALGLAAEGEGGSRRKAEQAAAQRVLEAALGG